MALLYHENAFARSIYVRLQGTDLRHLPRLSANNPRVAKQPVFSHVHADVTASTRAQAFSRQLPRPLIQQPTSKRSGYVGQNTVHACQSDAPVEQQIDPPPPRPKFRPFTPQVRLFCSIRWTKQAQPVHSALNAADGGQARHAQLQTQGRHGASG